MSLKLEPTIASARIAKLRLQMRHTNTRAVILPVGGNMTYFIGHAPVPTRRLSALVIHQDPGIKPTLVATDLDFPSVRQMPDVFDVVSWGDGQRGIDLVIELLKKYRSPYSDDRIAIGDELLAGHFIKLMAGLDLTPVFCEADDLIAPIRRVKDAAEIRALQDVAAAVDSVITDIQMGIVPLRGRTERQVAADIDVRMKLAGHDIVDFVLVAYGPNAANPHHYPPTDTVIGEGIVLFDIGGTMNGYHSDTTRCVHVGTHVRPEIVRAYSVLKNAQEEAVNAIRPGMPAEYIDQVARAIIETRYSGKFTHRTGHGIGMNEHEHPNIEKGNTVPLEVGNAFSVEPGIYLQDDFGLRIEDIVVVTRDGCVRLNQTPHELFILD